MKTNICTAFNALLVLLLCMTVPSMGGGMRMPKVKYPAVSSFKSASRCRLPMLRYPKSSHK